MALVGACSNIIGVSGYEIDPALDEPSAGGKGSGKGGTESRSGSNTGANGGEGGDGTAGSDSPGGKTSMGGKGSAGSATGDAGMGGEPPVPDCTTAAQCDDEIDCTTDSCNAGSCVHTPKDTLCDSAQCETCTVGIGCVAGPKDVIQLLENPSFDLSTNDWDMSGDSGEIVTLVGAHSGTKAAQFGPAPVDATEQGYGDALQWVTIPEGTVALTLTGWYRANTKTTCRPGCEADPETEEDYVVAALYEEGGTRPFSQFHSFEASSSAAATFKMFSYNAPKADVKEMGGNEYSLDLVAVVWDSVYYFDTLQLNATVCQ